MQSYLRLLQPPKGVWRLVFGLMVALVGCKKSAPSTPPSADSQPAHQRIVSLAPNLTEILFALGAGDNLVGATEHCNWPPAAKSLPRVGSFWQPDAEAVLALRPTLVLGLKLPQQEPLAAALTPTGCRVLLLDDFEQFEQLFAGILTIGAVINQPAQAAQLVDTLHSAVQQMRQHYQDRPKKRVLWVIQRQPLRVAGTKTFVNHMLQTVGAVNAIGDTLHIYPPISAEEMLAAAPEVIIEPANMPEDRAKQYQTAKAFYAVFSGVPAVANGRIYIVDGDLTCRLGPRLPQALAEIADCIWKENAK